MILYLSMILGVLLVVLGKLNKTFPKADFSWSLFIRTNLISTVMALVSGLFLVINQSDLVALFTKIFPESPFLTGGLFAGICGVSGVTIIQYLVDMATPGKKTSLGVNK